MSIKFFDDIFIPANNLQKPYRFDEREQLFLWQYDTGESTHELFIDIDEDIRFFFIGEFDFFYQIKVFFVFLFRFKVKDEFFHDTTPNGPPKKNDGFTVSNREENKSPYSIIATIDEPGLGLLTWWN